jgi:glycerol-3-phosphate O-acyltransferase
MDERRAVLASYYRNNIVHVFVLPALVAAAFINRQALVPGRLKGVIGELYSCLRGELYLRLARADLDREVEKVTDAMLDLELLESKNGELRRPAETSARAAQLRLTAKIVQPFFERYYLCVALLMGEGSATLTARELVRRCGAASERLALIYSLDSPDLFQAGLFDRWVTFLEDAGVLAARPDRTLAFDEATLEELASCLGFALPAGLRQTLVNLAGAAARQPSGDVIRRVEAGERAVRRSSPESERSRAE